MKKPGKEGCRVIGTIQILGGLAIGLGATFVLSQETGAERALTYILMLVGLTNIVSGIIWLVRSSHYASNSELAQSDKQLTGSR